jgi:predicted SprT family Zn-dependent metalloprotease
VNVASPLPTADRLAARAAELLAAWRVLDTRCEVRWNDRLATTAGRAFVRRGLVELNPTLLAAAPEQIDVVLVHEVAHVAAHRLYGEGIAAHGRHWRALMRLAGLPPAITHDIPLDAVRDRAPARRKRRRFLYLRVCGACGDRVIQRVPRYGRCGGCSSREAFRVWKAPASAAGRAALEAHRGV